MSTPVFSHVIFDLDGTILDTLEDLAFAANHTCELFGWPTFPVHAYRYKVGNGMERLVERLAPAEFAGDSAVLGRALAELRSCYEEHKYDHTKPYEGVIDMLSALRTSGVTLAVLTNKDHTAAAPLVDRHFGACCFQLVQGHIEGYEPKPAAPITLHVLEQLDADPKRTLYVGDSNVDVETGHNAGLRVTGAAWGFRGRDELEAAGADYIIDAPAQLIDIVCED